MGFQAREMTMCLWKGRLRLILFIVLCGTVSYFTSYIAYHVRWRHFEMESVLGEDNNDVILQRLALRKNLSTCSNRSTKRGPHQRVISYSFYGSDKSPRKYFEGIMTNAVCVAKYYPGWVMRIYCNTTLPNMALIEEKFSFVDICVVDDIEDHGKLGEKFGMLWRFLPMADPLVDVFMSRDLDSIITPRELAAVNEWLNSSKTFHIMRDHPQHETEILGGMWGAQVFNNIALLRELLAEMLSHGNRNNFTSGLDQLLLKKFVWQHTNGPLRKTPAVDVGSLAACMSRLDVGIQGLGLWIILLYKFGLQGITAKAGSGLLEFCSLRKPLQAKDHKPQDLGDIDPRDIICWKTVAVHKML